MAKIIPHCNGVFKKTREKQSGRPRSPSFDDGPRIQHLLKGNCGSNKAYKKNGSFAPNTELDDICHELQLIQQNSSESSLLLIDDYRAKIKTDKIEFISSKSSEDSFSVGTETSERSKSTMNGIKYYADKSTETLETDESEYYETRENKKRLHVKFNDSSLCSVVKIQPEGNLESHEKHSSEETLWTSKDVTDCVEKLVMDEDEDDSFLTYCMFITCNIFGWL